MDIVQEQVGDLILLGSVLRHSGLVEVMDTHFPVHGNWVGPSVGQLTMGWLMYILSECDHRVSHVEQWASQHIRTLRWALAYPELEPKHFQDDRLDRLLEYFSQEKTWLQAQTQLNKGLLRIYELRAEVVRLDSANATSFREPDALFRHGVRKKHQAELPQLKVMLACLDPIGLPLSCYTVAGNQADDQLYLPVLQQAQQSLPQQGLLYIGDSKLGNHSNFSFIARSANYYLCPLSQTQFPLQMLAEALEQAERQGQALIVNRGKDKENVALVYELPTRTQNDSQGEDFSWQERLFLVQSPDQAQRQKQMMLANIRQAKITIAERFLPKQGRQTLRVGLENKAQAFIDQVLKKYKVQRFLQVKLVAASAKPTDKLAAPLKVDIGEQAQEIALTQRLLGWRAFATNAPATLLDAQGAILHYHSEYLIEQQFHRLLTKTTALMPIFLRKPNRIEALIRLLMLALQLSALIQHKARKKLQQTEQHLTDIVPGNPGRKVARPTCEAMLKTFCAVAVVWTILQDEVVAKVTNLRPVNIQILELIGLPPDLYQHFALSFKNVKELGINLSET